MKSVIVIEHDAPLTREELSRAFLIAAYKIGRDRWANEGEVLGIDREKVIATWRYK